MLLAGLVLVVAGGYYAVSALLDPHVATTGLVLVALLAIAVGAVAWMLLDRSARNDAERDRPSRGHVPLHLSPHDDPLPELQTDRGVSEVAVR
jgi:hypothetical protein